MTDDGLVVLLHEPLARHTPLRTGGPCDAFVIALTEAGLVTALRDCRRADTRVTLLGAGTRTVFRDGPVPGVVVRLGGELASLGQWPVAQAWPTLITCGAGAPVPALVARAAQTGWSGLEPFACTAGTLGAAVQADDRLEERVEAVGTIRRDKVVEAKLSAVRRRRAPVVWVRLRLEAASAAEVRRRTDQHWRQAVPTHPGSFYEAPRRGTARDVLRSVRLPMVRLRRVAIPEEAPECMVNLGGGTAADLALLHRSALDRVKSVRGMTLRARPKWQGSRE